MELVVYGAVGPKESERELAYRLLELALQREYGLESLPEIRRAVKEFFRFAVQSRIFPSIPTFISISATAAARRYARCPASRWGWMWSCCALRPGVWRGRWGRRNFSGSGRQRRQR